MRGETDNGAAGRELASPDARNVAWIDLDGAVNVRDLGGLPAGDGKQVIPGRLLRGDNLQDLSPDDVRLLVDDLGVTTVIDLRSPQEVTQEGPGPLTRVPSVRHVYHSLLPELGTVTDAAASDEPADNGREGEDRAGDGTPGGPGRNIAAEALALSRRDKALGRSPDEVRSGYYIGYLEDRPDQVVAALRAIASSPGAALVHCAAGKDRTGVVVALALTVAGAGPDAVIADYVATGQRMHAVLDRLRASPTYAEDTNSRPAEEYMPRPEMMATFLDVVQSRYGGVLAWLDAHGFGAADVAALRSRLTSP